MAADAVCCGSPSGSHLNSCPFDVSFLVVGEDVPLDLEHVGMLLLAVCSVHVQVVERFVVDRSLSGEVTLCPIEFRQQVVDALETDGHQVWHAFPRTTAA